jgi:DNA-binding SARP family transcriptional activator
VAQHQWTRAWPAALAAMFVTRRRFMPEVDAQWADEWRARLDLLHQRSLTYYAEACLGIGGPELGGAERSARRLIELAPLSETGYRLLMRVQADQGDIAAALVTCERLRRTLREELGVAPGPLVQQLLADLLS